MTKEIVVGIVSKPAHPQAKSLTEGVIAWLRERNIKLRVEKDSVAELNIEGLAPEEITPRALLSAQSSPIVVLGGDGTLISVCRHPQETPPIIVGVNLGTLGFLTEITTDELFSVLEDVLAGTAPVESRSMLQAEVRSAKTRNFHAVNDVVITKHALARIFGVEVMIDGAFAAIIRGDGVIVSTPGGSTAYSLAAGGSIVHPGVNGVLITPICPHSLTSRPLVVPASSKITLRVCHDTNGDTVYLTIDGQEGMPLKTLDEIEINTSPFQVRFAKSPSRNYYEVLGTKLKWASW